MFVHSVNIEDNDFDGLAILFTNVNVDFMQLNSTILSHMELDDRLGKEPVLIVNENSPGSRVLMGPVGSLNGDVDDLRRFSEAARSLLKCCTSVGIKRPLFWMVDPADCSRLNSDYRYRKIVTMLALEAQCYIPLQAREVLFPSGNPNHEIGIYDLSPSMASWVGAVDSGRRLAKDIGGADPERMAPMKCANYILDAFRSENDVSIAVYSDPKFLKAEYPLLDAVSRASYKVARHAPCVVRKYNVLHLGMEYFSPDQAAVEENIFLIGKGVTYDTGGADIKHGGHMKGMSRDKCGAAACAGFMKTVFSISLTLGCSSKTKKY